jgi:hypothetical protein
MWGSQTLTCRFQIKDQGPQTIAAAAAMASQQAQQQAKKAKAQLPSLDTGPVPLLSIRRAGGCCGGEEQQRGCGALIYAPICMAVLGRWGSPARPL